MKIRIWQDRNWDPDAPWFVDGHIPETREYSVACAQFATFGEALVYVNSGAADKLINGTRLAK